MAKPNIIVPCCPRPRNMLPRATIAIATTRNDDKGKKIGSNVFKCESPWK